MYHWIILNNCFICRVFSSRTSSATAQRGIGFSVTDIFDPANLCGSSGSSEKDADRELAAVATAAAGKFVSSSSAVTHIFGVILKISACCEVVRA